MVKLCCDARGIIVCWRAAHKSAGAECGASAQNQATQLFQFFREDDGYNETFPVAKW